MNNLSNYFNSIYIITTNINNSFNVKYQIENSVLKDVSYKQINMISLPKEKEILKILNLLKYANIENVNDLRILLTYYNIIVNALENNEEHILIFDDTFILLKDQYANDIINNIPNDFDIIQFSYDDTDKLCNVSNVLNDLYLNEIYFMQTTYHGFKSVNGLGLSKKGMESILNTIYEKISLFDLDTIIYNDGKNKFSVLKHYISTLPLVYVDNEYNQTLDKSLYNFEI